MGRALPGGMQKTGSFTRRQGPRSVVGSLQLGAVLGILGLLGPGACGEPATPSMQREEPPPPVAPEDMEGAAAGLDVNDVSVLFPLPARAEEDSLLRLSDTGPRGVLLPVRHYEGLPPLLVDIPALTLYSQLRVVALRFDPCFPGDGGVCRAQLRLVAQPVSFSRAEDAAVHLFYELGGIEARAVAERLLALKALSKVTTTGRPLGVHPGLLAEGAGGPLLAALRRLVLDHAGEQNLSRVAVMGLRGFGSAWSFSAFDVQGDRLVPVQVAHVAGSSVDFSEATSDPTRERRGTITPSPSGGDDAVAAVDSRVLTALPRAQAEATIAELLRIENPERNTPATVDCVSCHVATRARLFGERVLGLDTSRHPDRYVQPAGTTPGFAGLLSDDPFVLRAFGYLSAVPAVSQRTLNESAHVVTLTRALLRGR